MDQLSFEGMWLPFKTVFAGSRQPCGLPLSQCVRKGGGQSFGFDRVPASALRQPSSPMDPAGLYLLRRSEWWISPLSKACGFPFKTVFAGSRQPCGLPLSQCVRKSGGQSFGLTVYLLPHYGSHPAPWAQQAFTCCADLNGGSALFRRHVAFPSRQFFQVPGSLVVCPCRNVLGL
jgi:hypothetical protein